MVANMLGGACITAAAIWALTVPQPAKLPSVTGFGWTLLGQTVAFFLVAFPGGACAGTTGSANWR